MPGARRLALVAAAVRPAGSFGHSLLERLETGAEKPVVWLALAITASIVAVGTAILYWERERSLRGRRRRR